MKDIEFLKVNNVDIDSALEILGDLDTYNEISADFLEVSESRMPKIEEYKNLTTISLGDFEKKILAKEDMTVLITSTTCYYCAQYEPIVNEVYGELNEKIYRINANLYICSEKFFRYNSENPNKKKGADGVAGSYARIF